MRVLVVAPEICPPWTEGRKHFVRDLVTELADEADVHLLTTGLPGHRPALPLQTDWRVCRHGAAHLASLLVRLPGTVFRLRPEAVLHFPYGTFHGLRGIVNDAALWLTDLLSRTAGVPCATVMYAIDEHRRVEDLVRRVSRLVITPRDGWRGPTLDIAVDARHWPRRQPPDANRPPTLLFMAGMWQPTAERLEHVIYLRGLGVLLEAGQWLASRGVRTIAAVPLLADSQLCARVRAHPLNRWPAGQLELRSTAQVPSIYHEADLFAFPYQEDITQFTPTSVIEAMMSGTPVLLSDAPFLRPLAEPNCGNLLFRSSSAQHFAHAALDALADPTQLAQRGAAAERYARSRWSPEQAVKQLRALLSQMSVG